jgi:hypothetical protein
MQTLHKQPTFTGKSKNCTSAVNREPLSSLVEADDLVGAFPSPNNVTVQLQRLKKSTYRVTLHTGLFLKFCLLSRAGSFK